MTPISKIPEDQIKLEMRVQSLNTNTLGIISHLDPDTRNGLDVEITWDNGEKSLWWACDFNNVCVVGQ